jgi:hypothetical protein
MRSSLRIFAFLLLAVAMTALAGLPWVLIARAELYWSPAIDLLALAVSK